jgi:hypothetical protein
MPSRDVASDLETLADGPGAEVVFAIERFGTRVAMLRLADGPPDLVLAEHLEGEQPVLVYRVDGLAATVRDLADRGIDTGPELGIPFGPMHTFTVAGKRLAIYEVTRPENFQRLAGRRDF